MSKAILVMNMPSSCSECPCCYIPRCEVLEKSLKTSEIYECKPNWCPLKEVPKKKKDTLMTNYSRYVRGWNDCIDRILEGSEEDG